MLGNKINRDVNCMQLINSGTGAIVSYHIVTFRPHAPLLARPFSARQDMYALLMRIIAHSEIPEAHNSGNVAYVDQREDAGLDQIDLWEGRGERREKKLLALCNEDNTGFPGFR